MFIGRTGLLRQIECVLIYMCVCVFFGVVPFVCGLSVNFFLLFRHMCSVIDQYLCSRVSFSLQLMASANRTDALLARLLLL